jgi:hypothetical protein
VVGQLCQVIVDSILEQRLDRLARALMQEPAALDQHGIVRHLLSEHVLEGIFFSQRGLLVDELAGLQALQHRLQPIVRAGGDMPDQAQREVFADDRQDLQQVFLGRWQRVDA